MDNAQAPWELSRVRGVLVAVVLFVLCLARLAHAGVAEELDRVRADPALASDPAAIDGLVREADASPAGVARTEAWSLAGEAYANRLGRKDDAARQWEKILADAGSDPVLERKAARDLVSHRLATGNVAGARAIARGNATLERDVVRHERRGVLRAASIGSVAALVIFGAITIVRVRRLDPMKRIARFAIAYGIYVAAAGALLASGYERGHARPFLLLGAALPPLFLLARAWGSGGSPSTLARVSRALVSAASVLGAAFLVLERVDATYLEGFGL